ncbi:MAG: histidine kinase [Eubacterium sp.]|nr:histidine kinase [Eubacterium sp.]
MNKQKNIHTSFAQKIITRFIILEIIIFACIILSLFLFLLPFMVKSVSRKNDYIANSTINQLDSQLQNIYTYFPVISQSQTLKELTEQYMVSEKYTKKYAENRAKIALTLNSLAISNPYCRNISIEFPNDDIISSISKIVPEDYAVLNGSEYENLIQGKRHSMISEIYSYQNGKNTTAYSLAYSRQQKISGYTVVITIFTDITPFFNDLCSLIPEAFHEIALYDTFHNLLYRQSAEDDPKQKNLTVSGQNNTGISDQNVSDAQDGTAGSHWPDYCTTAAGSYNLCTFTGYISPLQLCKDFIVYFITVILIIIVSFVATIYIFMPMLIRNLKEQNRLRFSLIISQIAPHFVFNTMNIISALAKQKRCDDVIRINSALINLLRDRLRISETEFLDSVRQEIDVTKDYIKIMQFRTDMDVVFHWLVPEELFHTQIPKNILQSLIENALLHGLYNPENGTIHGIITIFLSRENNHLILKVSDNGKGISEKSLQEFYNPPKEKASETRGQHIGMQNICERLKLIYPTGNASVDIYNIEPHGAEVMIKIPE